MFIHIERGSSVPISRQIAGQMRSQCLSGQLAAGAKLPSVRELAQQLAVNVNTVFRVYERLAAEGLIELKHGDGTYVRRRRIERDAQLSNQRDKFAREFDAIVHQGLMLGLSVGELREQLTAALAAARKMKK